MIVQKNLLKKYYALYITLPFYYIRAKCSLVRLKCASGARARRFESLLDNDLYQAAMSKEIKDDLYLSRDWKYFGNERYYDHHLAMLFMAMSNYGFLVSRKYFLLKKHLLNYQAQLI